MRHYFLNEGLSVYRCFIMCVITISCGRCPVGNTHCEIDIERLFDACFHIFCSNVQNKYRIRIAFIFISLFHSDLKAIVLNITTLPRSRTARARGFCTRPMNRGRCRDPRGQPTTATAFPEQGAAVGRAVSSHTVMKSRRKKWTWVPWGNIITRTRSLYIFLTYTIIFNVDIDRTT